MPTSPASQTFVDEDVVLDGRLALFHQRQRWLAVADLHFGYELCQRAAGRLMPMWGMKTAEERLKELAADFQPRYLILLGDLVHDRTAAAELRRLLERLAKTTEPIALAGNHDREIAGALPMLESWQMGGFHFHHGHCASQAAAGLIQIVGHHHPAGSISDGAGLHLKLPAFVQQGNCWILPAFSPWASGVVWEADEQTRMWLCTPERILPLAPRQRATG